MHSLINNIGAEKISNPVYFIIESEITNMSGMQPYLAAALATVQAFEGQPLVSGGEIEHPEGEMPQGKTVILKFENWEKARQWYHSPAYQGIISHRLENSTTARGYFVEGIQ